MDPALAARRGYFGAWFGDIPESESSGQTGVVVKKVYAGMAAEKSGLKEGEIVIRINGALATDPPTAVQLLAGNAAGEKVRLTVIDKAGGASRSFDLFAIMGDTPSAEFAKLKKTYVRCASPKMRFCNTPGNKQSNSNQFGGHSTATLAGWCLLALLSLSALALFVNALRRTKRGRV